METPQLHINDVSVLLLAGGNSTRMGSDKGLLPIEDATFVERLVAVSQQVSSHVFLSVGAHNASQYAHIQVPQIVDVKANLGPITGIVSAIPHISTPWVYVLSVDAPFITTSALHHLWNQKQDTDGAVFASGDDIHPLIGVYHHRALAQYQQAFDAGNRKLRAAVATMNIVKVPVPKNQLHVVKNINTKEDYLAIEKELIK